MLSLTHDLDFDAFCSSIIEQEVGACASFGEARRSQWQNAVQ